MHPSSVFVALLVAAQLSGGLSFVVVARSPSLRSFLASTPHAPHAARPTATPLLLTPSRVRHTTTTAIHAAGDVAVAKALPRRGRRRSCLGAVGDASGGEESAPSSVPASDTSSVAPGSSAEAQVNSVGDVTAAADAVTGGAAGAGLDLAKGISFEAPKPQTGGAEVEEEESESKKVRAI